LAIGYWLLVIGYSTKSFPIRFFHVLAVPLLL
jgi:hypothetical protein